MKIQNQIFIFIHLLLITNLVQSTQEYQFPPVLSIQKAGLTNLHIGAIDVQFIDHNLIQDHHKTVTQYKLDHRFKTSSLMPSQNLTVSIQLHIIDQAKDYKDVTKTQENYTINVLATGHTELQCQGYVSFLRAIETLAQLISSEGIIYETPIFIKDEPSYAHRGILLDTARVFYPIDILQKIIKGMQMTKLNVFHWHITDSESFPMFVNDYPNITKFGAYSEEEIYSVEDIQKLVEYGQSVGVVIIPEVDNPSHTRSWTNAPELNELNACHDYPPQDWATYCLEPPCGQLDVTLEKTYDLINSIFKQINQLFSYSYIHLGADEVQPNCWDFKPSINRWMQTNQIQNYVQLLQFYIDRSSKLIPDWKKIIYWFNSDSKLINYPPNSVIQYWGVSSAYSDLQAFNNPVILSPVDYLYFDCGTQNQLGDPKWCQPYNTWKHIYYNYKPQAANLGSRLLGSEICIWSEFEQASDVETSIFPRAIAFGLKQWNAEQTLDQPALVKTLLQFLDLFKQQGIQTDPITDEYCARNVDRCFFK